ncbi:unnamed protein product [Rotaria sordida]|uniref:Glycosyl hydrolase-like 10 domain-containing protein n=1 Tax=Rotaria sordida TaxID=392033 RepID=A0A815LW02_9BILA|nr:unnamed protein product [Rotaria sordida]
MLKADWRRSNVNYLVESLYNRIHAIRPKVKFGVSPFGIWKSGTPAALKEMNEIQTKINKTKAYREETDKYWNDLINKEIEKQCTSRQDRCSNIITLNSSMKRLNNNNDHNHKHTQTKKNKKKLS